MCVDKILSFDWCSFVLDRLCKAILSFKKKPLKKNINGCVLVLPLLYFHRLKWQGIQEPCTLPLIQHWGMFNFKKRILAEIRAGEFAQGEWVKGVYPVSCKISKSFEEIEEVVAEEACPKDGKFVHYVLPLEEKDDTQIRSIAKDALDESFLLLG